MEKKIYLRPELEVVEIDPEENIMQFGNTSIAFPPKEEQPGQEYPDV